MEILNLLLETKRAMRNASWHAHQGRGRNSLVPYFGGNCDLADHFGAVQENIACPLIFGRVVAAIAGTRWYKVQAEAGLGVIECCLLSHASTGVSGAQSLAQIGPDDQIFFLWHARLQRGYIVGSVPRGILDPGRVLGDRISQQGRAGLQVEQGLCALFDTAGGLADWASGRPTDSLLGENGWATETGLMFFIDPAMLFMRVSEDCGIWGFLDDHLLRLAGRNLQIRSSAAELEHWNDEGETAVLSRFYPYIWEAMGAWEQQFLIHRRHSAEESQLTRQHLGVLEPLFDDQQPFARVSRYDGYLGGGGLRLVCLPPPLERDTDGNITDTPNRYSVDRILPGVFAEHVALTGAYSVSSAKSIRWAKQITLPHPKQRYRPEDAQGDKQDNYRAASAYGTGPDHRIKDFENDDQEYPELTAAASVDDRRTHASDYEALLPFRAHIKDWQTPDSKNLGSVGGITQARLDFTKLRTRPYISAPAYIPVAVDHRYGQVNYCPNVSYWEQTDSGGIQYGCGYGSEMRMLGGNVDYSAPGDLVLRAGRNIILEAGADVIIKGRNCVDLSSTRGDVRIRSGSILKLKANDVEIHADADITFRAQDGVVRTWAHGVYVRAGVPTADGIERAGAGIFLDSGKGTGLFTVHAKTAELFVRENIYHYFVDQITVLSG